MNDDIGSEGDSEDSSTSDEEDLLIIYCIFFLGGGGGGEGMKINVKHSTCADLTWIEAMCLLVILLQQIVVSCFLSLPESEL